MQTTGNRNNTHTSRYEIVLPLLSGVFHGVVFLFFGALHVFWGRVKNRKNKHNSNVFTFGGGN